jgi:hypothetical protein
MCLREIVQCIVDMRCRGDRRGMRDAIDGIRHNHVPWTFSVDSVEYSRFEVQLESIDVIDVFEFRRNQYRHFLKILVVELFLRSSMSNLADEFASNALALSQLRAALGDELYNDQMQQLIDDFVLHTPSVGAAAAALAQAHKDGAISSAQVAQITQLLLAKSKNNNNSNAAASSSSSSSSSSSAIAPPATSILVTMRKKLSSTITITLIIIKRIRRKIRKFFTARQLACWRQARR